MTTANKHLERLNKLRQAQAQAARHLKPLATQSAQNAHLSGEVDHYFVDRCDAATTYHERIDGFDLTVNEADALTRLKNLGSGSAIDNILEPIFLSLFDGTMRACKIGTQQGITPSRLYNECKVFTYARAANSAPMLDSYTEFLNEQQNVAAFGSQTSYGDGHMRRNDEDPVMMRQSKKERDATIDAHFGDQLRAKDSYDGKTIYRNRNHANSEGEAGQAAEVDHIIPCAEICNRLKNNKALSVNDIRDIINIDDNLAVTSQQNNRGSKTGKFDKSRDDIQKELDQGYVVKSDGKKHKLTEEERQTLESMVEKMDAASQKVDDKTNDKVLGNIKGDKDVQKVLAKDAANAAGHQALGDVIIFLIKPLYYELRDCVINGIEDGVGAADFKSALATRFGRMSDHVMGQALNMLKNSTIGFFKNFLSMLLEGIVNCFVGFFKNLMRMMKEGLKILLQVAPILSDKKTTLAQKGDAILKLVAGSLSIFASIGIESWLSSLGLPEPLSIILSSILTAVTTALVMFLLDKVDLFGVNDELKGRRIDEILRQEIDEASTDMLASMERLR